MRQDASEKPLKEDDENTSFFTRYQTDRKCVGRNETVSGQDCETKEEGRTCCRDQIVFEGTFS